VLSALPVDGRIHIHIAEQMAEVEDCIAVRGTRPVRWLLEHAQVDARWTLVHAYFLASFRCSEDANYRDLWKVVALCRRISGRAP
jgi:hypothetical protein